MSFPSLIFNVMGIKPYEPLEVINNTHET